MKLQKYYNFLKNIKGFSETTINIYIKYSLELVENNNNFNKAINLHSHTSNATKRVILSAYKSYLEFIKDKNHTLIKLPKKEYKLSDYITLSEYDKIIKIINPNCKMKIQKKLIVKLLFQTGIRSSELLSIKKIDIQKNQITINGKGKKQRYIYVNDLLLSEIYQYIDMFKVKNSLFNFKYKNLYKKIQSLSKILNKKVSPHMFRRGFATYCIEKGVDIYSVSQFLGHSDLNTTKTYIYNHDIENKMINLF